MKPQVRSRWSHQESPCLGGTLLTRRLDTNVGCSVNGEEPICSIWSGYHGFYYLLSNRVSCGHSLGVLCEFDRSLMHCRPTVNVVRKKTPLLTRLDHQKRGG